MMLHLCWMLAFVNLVQIADSFRRPNIEQPLSNMTTLKSLDINSIQELIATGWRDVEFYKTYIGSQNRRNVDDSYLMFWKANKVGSTTLAQIILSHAYCNDILPKASSSANYLCRKMALCAWEDRAIHSSLNSSLVESLPNYVRSYHSSSKAIHASKTREMEVISELIAPYKYSIVHEVCDLDHRIVESQLPCAFGPISLPPTSTSDDSDSTILDPQRNMTMHSISEWDVGRTSRQPPLPSTTIMKEVFLVRDPLARAVSVYYFLGEMLRYLQSSLQISSHSQRSRRRTGFAAMNASHGSVIRSRDFVYHGNETTAPSEKIALKYSRNLPYSTKGPTVKRFLVASHSWSLFATSPHDCARIVASDRMITLVNERFDESLVVLSHHLNWTLADVVVTLSRKALSSHPKADAWPTKAVDQLKSKLAQNGEYEVYKAAVNKLDQRILELRGAGVNVHSEVLTLRRLRSRVVDLCLSGQYLELYRQHLIKEGLSQHQDGSNRFREVPDHYVAAGHAFSFNREQLFSFDVCGNCEAHGILYSLVKGMGDTVENARLLKDIPASDRRHAPQLRKCPDHQ